MGGFGSLGGAPFENFKVDNHAQVRAFTSDCGGVVVEVATTDMHQGVSAALRRNPTIVTVAGCACFGVEDRTERGEDRFGPFRVQNAVYAAYSAECG